MKYKGGGGEQNLVPIEEVAGKTVLSENSQALIRKEAEGTI